MTRGWYDETAYSSGWFDKTAEAGGWFATETTPLDAPAGTTINPATGSVEFSGNAPTISRTVAPSTGAVAFSGNAPVVSQTINPTTGAVAFACLTAQSVTWTAAGDGSGYAVGIDTVSRAGASATAASYATLYDAGAATSYTLPNLVPGTTYYVGVSTYDTFGDSGTYSIVDTGDEFSFVAPGIEIARTINPATGAIAFAGEVPAITRTVAPTTGSVAFSGNAPTVSRTISPATGSVEFSGNAPVVTQAGGGSQTIVPETGAVAFEGNAPVITQTAAEGEEEPFIGGAWGAPRRRGNPRDYTPTAEQIHAERVRLGILPAETAPAAVSESAPVSAAVPAAAKPRAVPSLSRVEIDAAAIVAANEAIRAAIAAAQQEELSRLVWESVQQDEAAVVALIAELV